MFAVGKPYEILMLIGGSEATMWRTVESYEQPLEVDPMRGTMVRWN